tara:strand:- start:549 stop:1436 length:888 start_codon:yes stop_codon:yes gene_type:complete
MTNNFKAILLALVASVSGVTMNVLLKISLTDINVFTAGFLRFLFGFLLILPFIFYNQFQNYKTPNLKIHLTRGFLNIPMMLLGFSALQYIPLEQIKAISFITPIIVVVLSVIFLKEKIYLIRIGALVIGLVGVFVILRPGIVSINIGAYMVLCSCSIWSVVVIITKFAARVDSAFTILSYQYTIVTILSLPIALYFWQSPSSQTIIYLIFAGIAGTIVHLCINTAYKLTELSVLQPVNFSRLLIASLFGFIIFDEVPDIWTIIGGLIIFSSILIITYRETYLKKDIAKQSIPVKL